MDRYYIDLELNLKEAGNSKKNDLVDRLFKVVHGLLRDCKKDNIGLSFPKYSVSPEEKYSTLGRVFRLVSTSFEDLRDFVASNSIDNLYSAGVINITELRKVPNEFISEYVFKRHNAHEKNLSSTKDCVYVTLEKEVLIDKVLKRVEYKFYIKRIKVEQTVNNKFTTYGLGNFNGPTVPVF